MDDWILYSLVTCVLWAIRAICLKLASQTIDSNSCNLVQLPVRLLVTIMTASFRTSSTPTPTAKLAASSASAQSLSKMINQIGDMNLRGVSFAFVGAAATVFAGFLYGDALSSGGSGAGVAVITGSYPALSYIISVILGLEQIHMTKVLGVVLAGASCCCFAIAS